MMNNKPKSRNGIVIRCQKCNTEKKFTIDGYVCPKCVTQPTKVDIRFCLDLCHNLVPEVKTDEFGKGMQIYRCRVNDQKLDFGGGYPRLIAHDKCPFKESLTVRKDANSQMIRNNLMGCADDIRKLNDYLLLNHGYNDSKPHNESVIERTIAILDQMVEIKAQAKIG
jgi:hypothetical protein